jgi:hypothetical protein
MACRPGTPRLELTASTGPRKGQKPTIRRAWAEIREYTQREAQSREAMVSAVREDVLKELVKLKVSTSGVSDSRAWKLICRILKLESVWGYEIIWNTLVR